MLSVGCLLLFGWLMFVYVEKYRSDDEPGFGDVEAEVNRAILSGISNRFIYGSPKVDAISDIADSERTESSDADLSENGLKNGLTSKAQTAGSPRHELQKEAVVCDELGKTDMAKRLTSTEECYAFESFCLEAFKNAAFARKVYLSKEEDSEYTGGLREFDKTGQERVSTATLRGSFAALQNLGSSDVGDNDGGSQLSVVKSAEDSLKSEEVDEYLT